MFAKGTAVKVVSGSHTGTTGAVLESGNKVTKIAVSANVLHGEPVPAEKGAAPVELQFNDFKLEEIDAAPKAPASSKKTKK